MKLLFGRPGALSVHTPEHRLAYELTEDQIHEAREYLEEYGWIYPEIDDKGTVCHLPVPEVLVQLKNRSVETSTLYSDL